MSPDPESFAETVETIPRSTPDADAPPSNYLKLINKNIYPNLYVFQQKQKLKKKKVARGRKAKNVK